MFEQQQAKLARQDAVLAEKDFKIAALTHELAYCRRIRFGKASEALAGEQRLLFEESVDIDLAAIKEGLDTQAPAKPQRKRAGRQALPPELPRIEHRHEPQSCQCGQCGADLVKIGEDVSEQLDVEPARFFDVSRTTIGEIVRRAHLAGVSYPVPADWDNATLEAMLYPPAAPSGVARPLPDWAMVHRELGRKGVTLDLL